MKKVLIIIFVIITVGIIGSISWYNISLNKVSNESEEVTFTIKSGTGKKAIVSNLKTANLIKSELATSIYLKLHSDFKIEAGTYTLNRNMDVKDLFAKIKEGAKADNTVRITFKEGMRLPEFIKQIAQEFNYNYDDLIKEINSSEFLTPLIEEYQFLDKTILDDKIYYKLEGYLYPNTYDFYKNSNLTQIIKKMLNETNKQIDPYKIAIKESKYSFHELLTMASIIEKEATSYEDRERVSQVIYKRLKTGMSLGMDVTAYYGAKLDLSENISPYLQDNNPYNTRRTGFLGLPIGPICNPSISSIKAALNPSDTDYAYFVADIATKKVYFAKDSKEFAVLKEKYMK